LAVTVTLGASLSIFSVTESLADPPALCAEQDEVTLAVLEVKLCVPQPESMTTGESGSLTLHATLTLLVYQPLFPSVPLTTFVITGAVVSQLRVTLIEALFVLWAAELSVATAVIVFAPQASETPLSDQLVVPVAVAPFTLTL
jgi:hypothetical protein